MNQSHIEDALVEVNERVEAFMSQVDLRDVFAPLKGEKRKLRCSNAEKNVF